MSENNKTPQSESAARLLAESAQELARRQADTDRLYDLDLADLYVWELEVSSTWESMGSRSHTKHSILCLTEEVAWERAAHLLKEREVFGQSWQTLRQQNLMLEAFNEGRYQDVVKLSESYAVVSFKLRMTPILASGKPKRMLEG